MLHRRRVLAAKIETTVGTDITPGATDATVQVFDAEMQADITMSPRQRQGGFSPIPSVAGMLGGTCKFSIHAIGGASNPAWASLFLPACGLINTSLVWTPETNPPGTGGVKTLTISLYRDGTLEKLVGAMGNAVFNFVAGQIVKVDFTFKGVYSSATLLSDTSIVAPTYVTTVPPRFSTAAFTVGAVTPKFASATLDLGNEIILRESQETASGYHSALIVDRNITLKCDPEAVLVATYSPRSDWTAGTERALAWGLGTTGNKIAFAAPKAQVVNVQEGSRNKNQIDSIDYQLNGSSSLGDDELTLTFS